ncbi:hypothetical protein [Gordonia soli]|uniref:Uncharacterized protein n=1 Tax=Gordonia soli NBRC 108243 TaxID=1223545 RepID=M0QS43_9ACTN|nr:hypothetical protein [Gordonia soli]GAC70797.1 hypothetical protein GS4_41_00440 [Gordonia soli NBRC 108243]
MSGVRHHLEAMEQAYDEGYAEGADDTGYPNPYRKLLDDRREFVREQVENGYGALVDEDGDNVLGDDNAEWFDAVLDAHDEWLALPRPYTRDEAGLDGNRRDPVAEHLGRASRSGDIADLADARAAIDDFARRIFEHTPSEDPHAEPRSWNEIDERERDVYRLNLRTFAFVFPGRAPALDAAIQALDAAIRKVDGR